MYNHNVRLAPEEKINFLNDHTKCPYNNCRSTRTIANLATDTDAGIKRDYLCEDCHGIWSAYLGVVLIEDIL